MPFSSDDTVTSTLFTVSPLTGGLGTITNIPSGTPKQTFIDNLIFASGAKEDSNSVMNDPIISGDTLIVMAKDGTTKATYTITVNDAPPQ